MIARHRTPRPVAGLPALARLVAVAGSLVAGSAHAHEYRAGDIEIDHPHAAAPPPGAPSVAGYMSFANEGDEADRLLGATAEFADSVEMHTTTMDGDVARMRELGDGIEIPAGATVAFSPGATHLMFVAPKRRLEVGDALPVTLHFERAGDTEVMLNIEDGVVGESSEGSHEGHAQEKDPHAGH